VVDLTEGTEVRNLEGLAVGACDCDLIVGLVVGFVVGLLDEGLNEGWNDGFRVGDAVGYLEDGFIVGPLVTGFEVVGLLEG